MERPFKSYRVDRLEAIFSQSLIADDLSKLEHLAHELNFRRNTGRTKKLKINVSDILNQNILLNKSETKKTLRYSEKGTKKSAKIKYKLPKKSLNKMCMLGIDRAAIALLYSSDSSKLPVALRFRSRFGEFSEYNINDLRKSFDSLYEIPELLFPMPLKYFLEPFANNQLRKFAESLDRSFTVEKALKEISEPKHAKVLIGAKGNIDLIVSSLILHSQIIPRFLNFQFENDILNYVFKIGDSPDKIMNYIAPHINKDFQEIERIVYDNTHAFQNLTTDFLHQTKKWKTSSFNQLFSVVNRLPRTLKVDKSRKNITKNDYPETIKMCSVFLLAGASENATIKQKAGKLHDTGITNIRDLVLLSPELIPVWKSISKNKN